MSIYRDGEMGTAAPRTDRFFQVDGEWHFNTREGFQLGPFESILEAHEALGDYLSFIGAADPQTLQKFYQSLSQAA